MVLSGEISVCGHGEEFATSEALKVLAPDFAGVPPIAIVLFGGAIGA